MSVPGFDKLTATSWSEQDSATIISKFKGRANQWRSPNLKAVRDALRGEILLLQFFRCAYCRRHISSDKGRHEIDHIIPTSGHPHFTYTKLNLVATCKRCNWLKRDFDPRIIKRKIRKYPQAVDDWLWVHPYIHNYSRHITIIDGLIFKALNDNPDCHKRAIKLLEVCRLDEISTIERRAMFEAAYASQDGFSAVLILVGNHPKVSSAILAEQLKTARDVQGSAVEIEKIIDDLRRNVSPNYKELLSATRPA